jgi:RimJ/RimL family protein N-acetyltransferase
MSDTPWPPPLRWPGEPLSDSTVLLDRMTFDDIDRVVFACTDESSQRWLPLPSPYTEAEARSFIASREHTADSGVELTFAVRDAADRVLAGAVGLTQRGYRNEAEIGYWTAPDRRGKGWTARAVRLVARYALTTMPLRRVEILVAEDNAHSQAVAVAAGATFEGVRRRGLPSSFDEDALVYSLIRPDVEPAGISGR